MNLKALSLLTLLLIFAVDICYIEARGGRGGGGRGGGGGNRGGSAHRGNVNRGGSANRNFSRAPTTSRPDVSRNHQIPSRNVQLSGQRDARPNDLQRPEQGNFRPGEVGRPGQGNFRPSEASRLNQNRLRDTARDSNQQFLNNARNRNLDQGILNQKQQNYLKNRGEIDRLGRLDAQTVRNRIGNKWYNYRNWFDKDFFYNHNFHPAYWNNNMNWWQAAGWAGLGSWLGWGLNDPVYYDNGTYPIPAPIDSHAQTAVQPTTPSTTSTTQNITGDWYPLGVFAIGKDAKLAANSQMFMQLAVNKKGDLSGTYYNATTNQTHEIVGSVDKQTQLAVWKLADSPGSPSVSTGLYNLTKDTTDIAVDFPVGTDQVWTAVRLTK